MNSKRGFSVLLTLLLLIAFAMTALAHPRRSATQSDAGARPRYQLAERMCAGSQTQHDAVTVTRWTEWLGDNTRWQLPLLRARLRLHSTASIRTRLVHGTCSASPYHLDPITSDLWYPQADGRLGRTPRPALRRGGGSDAFGYGGLGSGSGWGGGGTGESPIGAGNIGSIGGITEPPPPVCNTAIITFEARFIASDWCGVRQGVPDHYIASTARVVATRPAYRLPPTRHR